MILLISSAFEGRGSSSVACLWWLMGSTWSFWMANAGLRRPGLRVSPSPGQTHLPLSLMCRRVSSLWHQRVPSKALQEQGYLSYSKSLSEFIWALNYISSTFNFIVTWEHSEQNKMHRLIWFFNILLLGVFFILKLVFRCSSSYSFFLRLYLFIFRERGRVGERKGEKHQCVVASHAPPPTGNLACNPGMCPDWELNQGPFGLQAHAQSTEPHQPGL